MTFSPDRSSGFLAMWKDYGYNIQMRIAILSRNRSLYSTRRLVSAGHNRGHSVRVVDTLTIAVEVGLTEQGVTGPKLITKGPFGLTRTGYVPEVDAIIPRIGTSVTFYGLAVVRQFEALGVLTTADASGIACSTKSFSLLGSAGLKCITPFFLTLEIIPFSISLFATSYILEGDIPDFFANLVLVVSPS